MPNLEFPEIIIQHDIEHFIRWQNSLQAIPIIREYREQMLHIRNLEVTRALQEVERGKDTNEVIQRLGHRLTQKFLHAPTVELRRASYEGKFNLLEWAKQLLQLK